LLKIPVIKEKSLHLSSNVFKRLFGTSKVERKPYICMNPVQKAEIKMNYKLTHTILDVTLVDFHYSLISMLDDLKNEM
jgi:hypothetical protein